MALEGSKAITGRIEAILDHPELLELSANNVALAKKYFDYEVLAERMKEVIEKTIRIRLTKTMNDENSLVEKAK